jgi:hypothetical protein
MRRNRRILGVFALLIAVMIAVPGVSYARALSAPGSATTAMRTVDWIRGHGGGGLVNAIENWYYTRHQPAAGPPNPASLPSTTTTTAPAAGAPARLPVPAGARALPGEGIWTAGRSSLVFTTYLRPDPAHLSVVAGVAWIRAAGTTTHLVAGTTQPGGSSWPGDSAVPTADVPSLVATFNSGWKFADITGGWYQAGRYARPLKDGQASFVIDTQGHVTVGAWGKDVTMTSRVAAVRQNLALIVDGGKPVAGLTANAGGTWGSTHNQLQWTWRSGAGVDAHGNLIYVAGDKMNLATLAAALADAGAVRGMQLDIHTGMASFSSWRPDPGGASATPAKLLPGMTRSAHRYLVSDQRDFFYVTAR